MTSLYDITATGLDGTPHALAEYRGKVLLIVNTASKCGFTPQYEGLEKLHEDFSDAGLAVLGFPCNQFKAQEPGDAAEIASFCSLTYDVKFPMFAKVDVNGPATHPLFAWLKAKAPGLLGSQGVKWNFTKFLVSRDGSRVTRFAPLVKPEALRGEVEKLLG
jgi:glutathione peroxidase